MRKDKEMKLIRELLLKLWAPICGLLICGILLGGCASSPDPLNGSEPGPEAVSATGGDTNKDGSALTQQDSVWRFQIGNQVIVTFTGPTEPLPPHEERIKEDGNLTLTLIGPIKAVGKTAAELQAEIHDLYVPKYYVRLTVVVKYASELSYYVLGEVRRPGPTAYLGKTTVTTAIGAASGFTEFASKTDLTLTRANGKKIKVNYKKAITDPKFDPQVFPGDSINVKRTIW